MAKMDTKNRYGDFMQAFAIVHPIIELEDTIILEFKDETEPEESRRYRLFLQKSSYLEHKLIVYCPNRDLWQDITAMLSPFYLASLKNVLLEQFDEYSNTEDVIS